jgi:hypothetical protein
MRSILKISNPKRKLPPPVRIFTVGHSNRSLQEVCANIKSLQIKTRGRYPTQEPKLLRELLEHLKAGHHQDIIRTFFEKYWAKRRANFEALLASIHSKKAKGSCRKSSWIQNAVS